MYMYEINIRVACTWTGFPRPFFYLLRWLFLSIVANTAALTERKKPGGFFITACLRFYLNNLTNQIIKTRLKIAQHPFVLSCKQYIPTGVLNILLYNLFDRYNQISFSYQIISYQYLSTCYCIFIIFWILLYFLFGIWSFLPVFCKFLNYSAFALCFFLFKDLIFEF